jgi:hypothetical protein
VDLYKTFREVHSKLGRFESSGDLVNPFVLPASFEVLIVI